MNIRSSWTCTTLLSSAFSRTLAQLQALSEFSAFTCQQTWTIRKCVVRHCDRHSTLPKCFVCAPLDRSKQLRVGFSWARCIRLGAYDSICGFDSQFYTTWSCESVSSMFESFNFASINDRARCCRSRLCNLKETFACIQPSDCWTCFGRRLELYWSLTPWMVQRTASHYLIGFLQRIFCLSRKSRFTVDNKKTRARNARTASRLTHFSRAVFTKKK